MFLCYLRNWTKNEDTYTQRQLAMAKFLKDELFSCENTQNQKKMLNIPLLPTQLD